MKKYIMLLMLLIISIVITSCGTGLQTVKRGDDSVVTVKSDDEEMNSIIDKARRTVNEFLGELNNPNTSGIDFSVKYPFDTDPGCESSEEHIWLVDIEKIDDKYYGTVANDPFYIRSLKFGDRVEFDINMISDWKYIKDGYLVGGESIVYFYNQMSQEEKVSFEGEVGFKIRDK